MTSPDRDPLMRFLTGVFLAPFLDVLMIAAGILLLWKDVSMIGGGLLLGLGALLLAVGFLSAE
jgi:hypothetical protein